MLTSKLIALSFACSSFAIELLPINIGHYEAATGIKRRSVDCLADFDPQPQAQLMYGLGLDDEVHFGNVTLEAPAGLPIVLLERFESLTEYVDCNGDDGHMSLTFKSEDAFERALKAWSFINQETDQNFLVITNHQGCGPDSGRHPYIITQLREDPVLLTTHLSSRLVEWSDVTHSYDLSWGQFEQRRLATSHSINALDVRTTGSHRSTLRPRDFDNSITNTKPIYLDVKTNPGEKTEIPSFSKDYKIFCTDCLIYASIKMTGRIKVIGPNIVAATATISFSNVKTAMTVSIKSNGINSAAKIPINFEHDIIGSSIPDLGISLGPFFKAGASVAYSISLKSTFQGAVDLGMTFKGGMKDTSALVTADVVNPKNGQIKGWDKFLYDQPTYQLRSLEHATSISLAGTAALKFGIEALKVGKLNVNIAMLLPEGVVSFTPAYAQGGLCRKGGLETGFYAVAKTDVKITAGFEAKLGDKEFPLAEIPLSPVKEKDFAQTCIEFKGIKSAPTQKLPPGQKTPIGQPNPKSKSNKPCLNGRQLDGKSCPNPAAGGNGAAQPSGIAAQPSGAAALPGFAGVKRARYPIPEGYGRRW